jgi:hypothetical protein
MWTQKIEYVDVEVVTKTTIQKQVWDNDTNSFIPMTLHKSKGIPTSDQIQWLKETYGWPGVYKNGRFWQYSIGGDFTVMDEKVYTWFQMKWGNK